MYTNYKLCFKGDNKTTVYKQPRLSFPNLVEGAFFVFLNSPEVSYVFQEEALKSEVSRGDPRWGKPTVHLKGRLAVRAAEGLKNECFVFEC